MFERIRTLLNRLRDVSDANALTERDLADLGISREQVLAFLTMPHDLPERVAAMGAIFGVPEAVLKRDHGQWIDLLTVCGHCGERGACSDVLSNAEKSTSADCDFCPNRNSFDILASSAA